MKILVLKVRVVHTRHGGAASAHRTVACLSHPVTPAPLFFFFLFNVCPPQNGAYVCNEKYNHKKIRVRIDQPVKSEQKAESDETHKTAEEDRKYVIQVCGAP